MLDHVVVLGAGVAGLVGARVVAEHAHAVTVLDRDRLPEQPRPRGGVPQSRHVHTLLNRGLGELDALFPGFGDDLVAAGAPRMDWTTQRFRSLWGWSPRYESGLVGAFCTRELLEHCLRRRVAGLANVVIQDGVEVTGLTGRAGAVTGLRWRERGPSAPGSSRAPEHHLPADLIIDASGRGSTAADWLAALGYPRPTETVVASQLGYASRPYTIPAGFAEDWRLLVVRNPPPSTRAAVLYPVEQGRWLVTLAGYGEDRPPHRDEGFAAFARSITGEVGALLDAAEPLNHIATYQRTANRWRHWEGLPVWPNGFLLIGDAICCFNPVYGQGMSVACIQAGMLGRRLATLSWGAGAADQARRVLTSAVRDPWTLATQEDFRFPQTVGRRTRTTRATHWWADQVLKAAVHDPVVHRRFFEVAQLLRPARDLAAPSIARRVLRDRRLFA